MVICEYCGKQAEASEGTCPSCGAPLPVEIVQETVTDTTSAEEDATVTNTESTIATVIGALAAAGLARDHEPPHRPHVKENPPVWMKKEPRRPEGGRPTGPAGHRNPGGHPRPR